MVSGLIQPLGLDRKPNRFGGAGHVRALTGHDPIPYSQGVSLWDTRAFSWSLGRPTLPAPTGTSGYFRGLERHRPSLSEVCRRA
ncbi:unnamed protein product [Anisakis simplex]|uniref:Uncharacterized protein n=1 Tax=Anisakis simplex TaxID=6269 RepID=A0A0M3J046_ANISI|nr:unnamed protein product [Anisakis simplex]